jgi:tetratricopeptide (TPR) repeat protein
MQANSPDEFDDYLQVLDAPNPADRIGAAKRFEAKWPKSEMLPHTIYVEAEAQRKLGDSKQALLAAEKAMQAAKDHIPALVLLGELICNTSSDDRRLAFAESYTKRALELMQTYRPPRTVALDEWERARNGMQARMHATFGQIAFKRGELAAALKEFEAAESIMPSPDPSILYRLAKLYRESGSRTKAVAKLKQVAAMDEPVLKRLAEKELLELQ